LQGGTSDCPTKIFLLRQACRDLSYVNLTIKVNPMLQLQKTSTSGSKRPVREMTQKKLETACKK